MSPVWGEGLAWTFPVVETDLEILLKNKGLGGNGHDDT